MMKKILTLLLSLSVNIIVSAQNKDAIQFSKSINKENAHRYLSIIASDKFQGRRTGEKGAWLAANYIRNFFNAAGLKGPVQGKYFQPVGLVYDKLEPFSLTIGDKPMVPFKDFRLSGYQYYLPKGLRLNNSSIFFAGYSFEKKGSDAYDDESLSGNIIMMLRDPDLDKKVKYFREKKVAGIIVVDKSMDWQNDELAKASLIRKRIRTGIQNETSESERDLLPYIIIGTAAANTIFSSVMLSLDLVEYNISEGIQPVLQEFKVPLKGNFKTIGKRIRAENVLGFLEGSDPKLKDEILVISSHYDHLGGEKSTDGVDRINNGADDDGSGTTSVLMLAEAFTAAKNAGKGPKRSILFITFVGEEKGLLGSTYYSENPIFPLENTIVNLNMDMIGRVDAKHASENNYVYTIGAGLISTELDSISKKANSDYVNIKLEIGIDGNPRSNFTASDHYNFAKHRIPVIFYFNGTHEDYHKPSDEVDKIDFPILTKRAQLVYYTAWELANADHRPRVDKE